MQTAGALPCAARACGCTHQCWRCVRVTPPPDQHKHPHIHTRSRPDFTPLAEWEREHRLHCQLVQLRVFCQHRWGLSQRRGVPRATQAGRQLSGWQCALSWRTPLTCHCSYRATHCLSRRRWKAFGIWHKAVRDLKTSGSSEKLQRGLLLLHPLLQQAVYDVRSAGAL
jgi:transposase